VEILEESSFGFGGFNTLVIILKKFDGCSFQRFYFLKAYKG
jgi:hypothetical protein